MSDDSHGGMWRKIHTVSYHTIQHHYHLHQEHTERNKEYLIIELSRGLTRYSTKQTCLSLVSIMHWSERKPRLSILIDILVDWVTAFWQGFKRASLYLKHSVYIDTVMHYCKEVYGILVLEGLLALKDLHHIRILWVVNLWKSYIHHPRCAVLWFHT